MNLTEAFDAALARYHADSFGELSARDQLLVTVWGLEADVNNGGFDQYYFNSSGDHAVHAPAALRSIGAPAMAAIVESANGLFGPGGPSTDRTVRQAQLFAITERDESAFENCDRDFLAYPEDLSALLATHFGLTAVV